MNKPMLQLEAIQSLLGELPSRKAVFRLPLLPVYRQITIRVERTCPFEFIDHLMTPYFRLWETDFITEYSNYDLSLSNIMIKPHIDAYILWMDWRLLQDTLKPSEAAHWFKQRIEGIRKLSNKPILYNNWAESSDHNEKLNAPSISKRGWVRELNTNLAHLTMDIPDCEVIDLVQIAQELGSQFYDARNDAMSQFPFSDQATMAIARHLGLHLFPALFKPRIKVLVCDLDDTLYQGVLGEDGIDGIQCLEGHKELHLLLLSLKQSGMLLAICSRNEQSDVAELFECRKHDFPLQWHDFAIVCANWQAKSVNIKEIAKQLNLSPADFLFIDDSTVELIKAANDIPALHLLKAEKDAAATAQMLSNYPGLYRFQTDDSASLRTTDIQANLQRRQLQQDAVNYNEYLSELQMRLSIFVNYAPHAKRLHELSHKTNQFNLSLRRFSETEIEQVLNQDHFLTLTAQLTDRLSDSGIIGCIVYQLREQQAELIELLISCRALGRDIETLFFAHSLKLLQQKGIESLQISIKSGPRNKPARDWLRQTINKPPSAVHNLRILSTDIEAICADHPAQVEVKV